MLWLGLRSARAASSSDEYLLAGRSVPWWAVGLSVMATQASAITVIGTTGQAHQAGMGFAQFYLGLPLAMVILAFTLLPLYRSAGVSTAYEWLGQRFDQRTRLATAVLFLVSRALALGVVVYAPSVVLSLLLGWSTEACVLLMTAVALAYTAAGGLRAVILTDVLQMLVVVTGLVLALLAMLSGLPEGLEPESLLTLAQAGGRTELLDWSFDASQPYTVWSGLLGGTFLFLAYFGCDQSQVQRLLAARSLGHARAALALNGLAKLPLQLFVLAVGAALFGWLQFDTEQPLLFDGRVAAQVAEAGLGEQWLALELRFEGALQTRRNEALALSTGAENQGNWAAAQQQVDALRAEARSLATHAGVTEVDDQNHIFPWFIVRRLPVGLIGLLLAAVFAAAMSSIDSELNALATTTAVDLWKRGTRSNADDRVLLRVGRLATVFWALVAACFALYAAALGSVIEAVNTVGSWFYGSLLGVFVLAQLVPRADGRAALTALAVGMVAVAAASMGGVAWLWLNPVGCLAAVLAGWLVSQLPVRRHT